MHVRVRQLDAMKTRAALLVAWGGPFGAGPVAAWLDTEFSLMPEETQEKLLAPQSQLASLKSDLVRTGTRESGLHFTELQKPLQHPRPALHPTVAE